MTARPTPTRKDQAKNGHRFAALTERQHKAEETAKAVAAFDALCAARPLKPPPSARIEPRTVSAAAAALAEDRRRGILGRPFNLDAADE